MLLPMLPVLAAYNSVQATYRCSSRELKRLDSLTRSPIYSHFSESLVGTSVIRSFNTGGTFIASSDAAVDRNTRCYVANMVANRWLGLRLEVIGGSFVLSVTVALAFGHESLSAGVLGLALSYALLVTRTLNQAVRMGTEVEMGMNAVVCCLGLARSCLLPLPSRPPVHTPWFLIPPKLNTSLAASRLCARCCQIHALAGAGALAPLWPDPTGGGGDSARR